MPKALRIVHRAGIDDLAEIVHHANSPACPKRMLELNPAFGCEFRCAYCGIYALEKDYFGEVIVYDEFPDYLDEWLTEHRAATRDHYFYFSAKTDCFQPALIESGITLACLEILRKHRAPYFLVTKGGIPPREICESMVAARDDNQVIISATMPTEAMREAIEPGAAPIRDRLALAEFCVENGIFVTASCCPILPISDRTYLKEVFSQLATAGINHFYFDFARLSREAVLNMIELLPEHRDSFERHYFTPETRLSRWHMPHRNVTIDKFQPPERFMLDAFKALAQCLKEVVPGATVSVCNHFSTPKTLRGFNDAARAECISCMGHRFDGPRPAILTRDTSG
ncbi:MAG: radical SAM protein [Planctomycetota bacterium]|jgi:DNA repair photolyase